VPGIGTDWAANSTGCPVVQRSRMRTRACRWNWLTTQQALARSEGSNVIWPRERACFAMDIRVHVCGRLVFAMMSAARSRSLRFTRCEAVESMVNASSCAM
jgi:hypothetical protein